MLALFCCSHLIARRSSGSHSFSPHHSAFPMHYMILLRTYSSTYDHRVWRTGLPVRSAVLKPHAGYVGDMGTNFGDWVREV
ncbi:uncharacterized protein N7503_007339 [Penicillium pulvis]|uniref:uncharacterized protein n=1 Tax=Penicillium pulvis TaxID=1562058 RepID=UPI0025491FCC|nr:uncharacterized protein N7503_007339 [Penicillium pulvis]KAJ5798043.1 hypothetical protein N7503_007339 [Penicillium pulvis]